MIFRVPSLKSIERRLRTPKAGEDISSPAVRRSLKWHYHLFDHAFLRSWWSNFDRVAEGVYRSNQPGHARLAKLRDKGIRAVLNLRGETEYSPYLFERESCEALGLTLIDLPIRAREAPYRERLVELIDIMRRIDRPFLMHCKSGADRTSLAAVLYLVIFEGEPLDRARRHLGLRYIHLRWTKTGIIDALFDSFAERHAETGVGLEDWVRHEYDPEVLTVRFAEHRARRKRKSGRT
ncbi:fused DSP-PTPase phosphatase/NAD kinase-like protein [Brevirhabdus sp.]|uniref:fused DSP-PTPase phosphatase/NAD kinase-like protein n=1 Tax=Brevirhabdus sp. TaxID=2004514 RepID=UPI004058A340